MAVNLLSCLSTLATHPPLTMEVLAGSKLHKYDKDEFNCVVRFNGECVCTLLLSYKIISMNLYAVIQSLQTTIILAFNQIESQYNCCLKCGTHVFATKITDVECCID